jgi:23S rRNA-/tRNA-specific pseudouridylate synthase
MPQNNLSTFDLVVPDDLAGQRLDRALASVTGLSRTRIQEAIKGGVAQVDGKSARASQILEAGQRVTMAGEAPMVASAPAGEAQQRTPSRCASYETTICWWWTSPQAW